MGERAATPSEAELLAALEKSRWNVEQTAKMLGKSRFTVDEQMKFHGSEREGEDEG